ncbi:2-dehydro-3-deoxygalactonokinase [Clostridium sp. KNHs216]|uniref:2-dehydro-3-deoxygalactonokinase n=1 Tax=Clostridium sp. KNHs216 TaxID=1550235 RepID=UPI001151A3F0|nr:2-dehydro-3-deoxygalactonokinase [Clostridium sp. KNHs216]TQI68326.1 2-dehydro-3-deoxygalactonokinase [Clostridium sp. KNHs216]
MKEYIITIDTGTTNTRCILWNAKRENIATEKSPVGVRNTAIDGNNSKLKAAVKGCLDALMVRNHIGYDDIKRVIASGMITSNVGLVEIPHVVVPASKEALASATSSVLLEDVCPLPIWFIPGVKNSGGKITLENFESMDIMRGEEVESIAIIDHYPKAKDYLLILPGSHTKFVSVDKEGQITGCLTTITGELLSSITNDTIIADAVGRQFVEKETYNKEMMLLGYDIACRCGIGRACFSGRILNQFAVDDKSKIANFIFGVALQNDILAIKNSSALHTSAETMVIVGGKEPFSTAFVDILEHDGGFANVEYFENEADIPLSAMGAYIIAELSHIL